MIIDKTSFRLGVLLGAALLSSCHRSPQDQAARFMQSAQRSVDQKDYARAILDLKNAVKLTPNDPEPAYRLGKAYLLAGDVRQAVMNLGHAVDLNPKHLEAQAQLAELMANSSHNDVVLEAQKRAEALLADNPGNPDALSVLALVEIRLGNPDQADQHLREALEKYPQHLNSSMMLANLRLSRRDLRGAEDVLKAAVAKAPDSAAPPVALGRFYNMLGRPADAEPQFQRALQVDPKNAEVMLDLGRSQIQAGRKSQAEETFRRLAALPDRQYRSAHASFLFSDGQRDASVAEFERLVKDDPKDRLSRSRLVAAYVATGKLAEGEKALTVALKQNPHDADALLQRSEIYLMSGRYAGAQTDLQEVLRLEADSAVAHYMLSKVHKARGAAASERQELTTALQLGPRLLEARVDLAKSLLAGGSHRAALDLLNAAPEPQKRTIAVITQRNWILQEMGDAAGFRQGIDQGLAIARTRDLLLQDAILKLSQKNFPGARKSAEEVLAHDPEDLGALEDMVLSYAAEKQIPIAIQRVRELAAERPRSAPLQHFLGRWLLNTGKRPEARAAFASALAADPGFKPACVALAQLDVDEGRLDEAQKILLGFMSAKPADDSARVMLGTIEERKGNLQGALEYYHVALGLNEDNVVALNNYAYLLATYARQPDEALKFAEKASELAPDTPAVQDTIGWILYQKGLYSSALKHFEQFASKASTGTQELHLALAYLKLGDEKRGQQAVKAALSRDPKLAESSEYQEFAKARGARP